MPGVETAPEMSSEELALLNEVISSYCGIYFSLSKKDILASRLAPFLHRHRFSRFLDYYLYLRFDTNGSRTELAHLVSALTNNETYFFRETAQLEGLFDDGIALLRRPQHSDTPIKVLCAGCSSGEEAYTLGFLARECLGSRAMTVDAFDIDAEKLRIAKQAEFGERSLRATNPEQRDKFFVESNANRYSVRPRFREGVRFSYGNILSATRFSVPAAFDVVICRNVLIYFSEDAFNKAIRNFAFCLRKGGLLLLGHSESIIGKTELFSLVRMGHSMAYCKA